MTTNTASRTGIQDAIEILSVEQLDQYRPMVKDLRRLARSLNLDFGWHYLLDLTWIISRLGPIGGKRILDAGAGTGILQWYLAQQGAAVTSVDRDSRAALPLRFRTRFRVKGLRPADLSPFGQVVRQNMRRKGNWTVKLASQTRELIGLAHLPSGPGKVIIYNQDLSNLKDIPDNSMDAIVAVSALEHNPPERLPVVVAELMRVLKPGAPLLATLNAAPKEDWWHTPSSGWCYSEASLRRLFSLPASAPANYDRYDQLFSALRNCEELRENLAAFYFQSEKNGMPWGVWDPQYIPVGVCKVKPR